MTLAKRSRFEQRLERLTMRRVPLMALRNPQRKSQCCRRLLDRQQPTL